jgi:hypothetical protein
MQLDLVVAPAMEEHPALRVDFGQVAAAVGALAVVLEQHRLAQVRAIEVATHHVVTGNAQLAVVEEQLGIGLGPADGQRLGSVSSGGRISIQVVEQVASVGP